MAASSFPPRRRCLRFRHDGCIAQAFVTAEVATWLGLSRTDVAKMVSRGEIPFIKICEKEVRFNLAELRAWAEKNRQSAPAEKVWNGFFARKENTGARRSAAPANLSPARMRSCPGRSNI